MEVFPFLTDLVDHLESDVQLQHSQDELEPGAHLPAGQRDVDGEHDVVGVHGLSQRFIEAVDLLAAVRPPRDQPAGPSGTVYTLSGQVPDGTGGTGSCGSGETTLCSYCTLSGGFN